MSLSLKPKGLMALIAVLFSALLAGGTLAQASDNMQLSVGTKFVKDYCLEAREGDSSAIINKCNAGPLQGLRYDEETGHLRQGDKCLAATTRGQPLTVTGCADSDDQKWTFNPNGTLQSDSGQCADILNFQKGAGTPVIGWECTGTENQAFFATRIKITSATPTQSAAAPAALQPVKGLPVIASYFTQGRCLNTLGNRGTITVDNCDRQPNQSFAFKSGVSGAIVQGDKCLSYGQKGQPLRLEACTGAAGQDWTFTTEGTLRNRDNLCADIFAFDTRAGTDVIAWDCTNTDNQKFYPAVATEAGSFSYGPALAESLRADSKITTVSMQPGFSALNVTGANGKPVSADSQNALTGGQNNTLIVGGAGVLTKRFVNGLAAPSVTSADDATTNILPSDWAFFSGATAGIMPLQ